LPVIPALGRQRQEDYKFEASQSYITKPSLKQNKINNKKSKSSQLVA
jgi:hypothetical protein